jgi:uncharacterized protein YndB with AHSA1/START domain
MANVINSEQVSLQITRHYPFPPAKVFRAWTDPQALKAWFAPNPAFDLPEADVDLRVGGRYRILMIAPDGQQHCVSGAYREVAPPVRLVFTWSWSAAPERESLVTVELNDRDGGTELVLTHEHFHDADERGKHEHGWNANLDRLGQLAL